jgi:hypothetical protein
LSIVDQFESWNQELMNLPTRCCYVKVQGHKAVKITSLKMKEANIDQKELAAVLGKYKHRYQRSKQETEEALKKGEAARQQFSGNVLTLAQRADAAPDAADAGSGYSDLFHNPFKQRGIPQDEEKRT